MDGGTIDSTNSTMKILFSISSLKGGGMERVMTVLASQLAERGHEVIVTMNRNQVGYQVNSKVQLRWAPNSKEFTGKESALEKLLMHIHNKLAYDRHIAKEMKLLKPDVVISFMNCYSSIVLNHGRIPIINSERNCLNRRNNLWERFNRFFLNRFFDKVVVLSRHDKVFSARWLKNTIVIPNPLSFTPLTEEEYTKTFFIRKNILACGRLDEPVKGFDGLIQAFSLIAAKYPDWTIDIAGGGHEKNLRKYQCVAKQFGIESQVNFLGHCSDVKSEMKGHSIFVLSSRREGFPNVLTEAMSMGCACVAYDCITGPGEIIVDTIDGLLVENQNVEKMSQALSYLIEDEDKRFELGKRAIVDVKRFSRERVVTQWEEMIRTI